MLLHKLSPTHAFQKKRSFRWNVFWWSFCWWTFLVSLYVTIFFALFIN